MGTSEKPLEKRIACFEATMRRFRVTYRALGDQLGVSSAGAKYIVTSETCRTEMWERLRGLGFPKRLLPRPENRRGKRPEPDWSGLAALGAAEETDI